jgi:hypothetical protein
VEDSSSELDNALERRDHINANHQEMCRFSGVDDPEYEKVRDALARLVSILTERESQKIQGKVEGLV